MNPISMRLMPDNAALDGEAAPDLRVGFGEWVMGLNAGHATTRERLAQDFSQFASRSSAAPQARLLADLTRPDLPVLHLERLGKVVSPLDLPGTGPGWERFQRSLEDRNLVLDGTLGAQPALRWREPFMEVANPRQWPLYCFILFAWLAVQEGRQALLHAATAVTGKTTLVIIGPSGTGKSTLAAALQYAGAWVPGDECVFVDRSTHALKPLRRSLALRPGGAELLGLDGEALGWAAARPGDPKTRVASSNSALAPTEQVVFIRIEGFSQTPALTRAGGREALRQVHAALTLGTSDMGERLDVSADLVERWPLYSLTAGTPAETAGFLREHFA